MKWNVDRELARLESKLQAAPAGTSIQQVVLNVDTMQVFKLQPKPEHLKQGCGLCWRLTLGGALRPAVVAYGHTIYEAFLRARKVVKAIEKSQKRKRS